MTHRFYVGLARRFEHRKSQLRLLLLCVWLGGFFVAIGLAPLIDNPRLHLAAMLVYFSLCVILGIVVSSVHWFNPDRDLADRTTSEGAKVLLLNFMLFLSMVPWFQFGFVP